MPPFGPISRRELIAALHRAGFEGPDSGGRHGVMRRGQQRLAIPNPHGSSSIGPELLGRILRQAGISRDEWEWLQGTACLTEPYERFPPTVSPTFTVTGSA